MLGWGTQVSDLSAWPDAGGVNFTGVVFPDRVALGAYGQPSPREERKGVGENLPYG